jgi:hypothetical protein
MEAIAMRKKAISVFAAVVSLLSVSIPLFAHHGTAAYDVAKPLTLKGTVTEWDWYNPHCLLQFDVKNEDGQVVHWIAETQNPVSMVNAGWAKASIKPGDEVTVTLAPARNGRSVGELKLVVLPNGKTLYAQGGPATKGSSGASGGSKSENYSKR